MVAPGDPRSPSPSSMTSAPAVLDEESAANYLGVTPRWIRRAVAERRIPHVKVGRFNRFRVADLDRFLEEHLVPASTARARGR